MPVSQPMTRHATERSRTRSIPSAAIEATVAHGSFRRARGAEIYILGWRDVRRCAEKGIDVSRFVGVEVVCANDGSVLTVYRNRKPASIRDRALPRAA